MKRRVMESIIKASKGMCGQAWFWSWEVVVFW